MNKQNYREQLGNVLSETMYLGMVSTLDFLHRMELALHDSLEWDFEITALTNDEYDFLHRFAAECGLWEDTTRQVLEPEDIINMLLATQEVFNFMRVNQTEVLSNTHVQQLCDSGILPHVKVVKKTQLGLWRWIPQTMIRYCEPGEVYNPEHMCEHCINVVRLGIRLLNKRGCVDKRRLATIPSKVQGEVIPLR